MVKFVDYRTTLQQVNHRERKRHDASIYQEWIKNAAEAMESDERNVMPLLRLLSEFKWHIDKRPFFNVYPSIENRLRKFDADIHLSEVLLPFSAMEIRTTELSVLVADTKKTDLFPEEIQANAFFVVVDFKGSDDFQELIFHKSHRLHEAIRKPTITIDRVPWENAGTKSVDHDEQRSLLKLITGVCMLAKDVDLVTPVVLSRDAKQFMTEDELRKYSQKAIKRTGRVGFDVGRKMEDFKQMHYRSGCFAKYYVGPSHDLHPGHTSNIAPVIKWRSGAVVNKKNLRIPTGFHG